MKRFYEGKEEILGREIDGWLGTPYKHYSAAKGKGVDCIHFVVRVLQATGGDQGRHLVIKKYNKDWHLHRGEELLRKGIEKQLFVELISLPKEKNNIIQLSEDIGTGDLVLFEFGRHAAHVGIFLKGEVYQTVNVGGVVHKSWRGDFFKRVQYVYKLYDARSL